MIDVVCAVIIDKNRILCVQRSEKMSLPLKWEFPGGKIEPGEHAVQCLKREIKEELNIDIEVLMEIHPQSHEYAEKGLTISLMPFVCIYAGGKLELHEHKTHLWLLPDEIGALDWAEADLFIVALLKDQFEIIRNTIETGKAGLH